MLFFCTSNSLLEIFILLDRLFLMKRIIRFKISYQTALLLTVIFSSWVSFGFIPLPLIEIIEINKDAFKNNGTSFSKTIEGQVFYQIYFTVVFINVDYHAFKCIKHHIFDFVKLKHFFQENNIILIAQANFSKPRQRFKFFTGKFLHFSKFQVKAYISI